MARGRMLNRSISTDLKVADLASEVGGFGVVFWTWLVAHLDRNGCAHAEPRILKGQVAPLIDEIDRELITRTLFVASRLGLIELYEVDGAPFLRFPKFEKNQVGLRKDREPDSGIPEPAYPDPETIRQPSGNDPEAIRTKGREGKGKEEKHKGPRQMSGGSLPDEMPPPRARVSPVPLTSRPPGLNAQVLEVFDAWRERHPDQYLTPHSGLREWCEIERRLTQDSIPVEKLKLAVKGIHHDDWEGRPRNLTLLNAVKSIAAVERFAAMATGPPQAETPAAKTARIRREREEERKRAADEARRLDEELMRDAAAISD
jgi:hypothetical protein